VGAAPPTAAAGQTHLRRWLPNAQVNVMLPPWKQLPPSPRRSVGDPPFVAKYAPRNRRFTVGIAKKAMRRAAASARTTIVGG